MSSKGIFRLLLPPSFVKLYLQQSILIKAEVVGYFMADHFFYIRFDCTADAAFSLSRLLKDTAPIMRNQSVSTPPPSYKNKME
jgi:hypothetical protein